MRAWARRRLLQHVLGYAAAAAAAPLAGWAAPAEHSVNARALFEAELTRRHISFSIDAASGRHALRMRNGVSMLVDLGNLEREVRNAPDAPDRVARFVDTVVAASNVERRIAGDAVYWCLEPSDHVERATFRESLSARVDKVLCVFDPEAGLITWLEPSHLRALAIDETAARALATSNLGRALAAATLETSDIDGVSLGMLGSRLPFKAALILAPNAREVLEPRLGWPLLAVVPDRDFLYLWAERHAGFAARVGRVVVDEFRSSAYPVSTEVYRLGDAGVEAIGEFPRG